MKYGEEKGNVGNILGDVPFDEFAKVFGGHGESVREAKDIQPALQRAREAVKAGTPAIVNIWVDKEEYAPGVATTRYTHIKRLSTFTHRAV